MSIEVRAQNTISLTSVKAIKDATDKSAELLAEMEEYAELAGTTLTGIYQDAEDAKAGAESAKESADTALRNLAMVQKVLEVVEWVAVHGVYSKTTDVTVNPNKTYYTVQATVVSNPNNDDVITYYELVNGAYVKTSDTSVVSGKTYYYVIGVPVGTPVTADIGTYYELALDEAMANYIMSHLALTNDGLYVVSDANAYKLLLASDGMYIEAPNGNIVNQSTANGNVIRATDGTVIAHLGYGLGASETGTATAPYYSLGTRLGSIGNYSVAEGNETTASGFTAHAEGCFTEATGYYSHAEGNSSVASGYCAHAEGGAEDLLAPVASGSCSHAEGCDTTASGSYSHVEGYRNTAKGIASHIEGYLNGETTEVSGTYPTYSHIEGERCRAIYNSAGGGRALHAQNIGTVANGVGQTAIGRYNKLLNGGSSLNNSTGYAFIIGNGTADSARANALAVDWNGNARFKNDIYVGCNNDSTGGVKVLSASDVTTSGEAGKIPQLTASGVLELRKYIDLHDTNSTYDFDVRMTATQGTASGEGTINFNCGTFKIRSSTLADFVVERGTSGIWTYRKWFSGIAECWGTTASASRAMTNPYANWYYATVPQVALPSNLFTSVTYANGQRSGGTSTSGLIAVSVYGVTTTGISSYIYTGASTTIDVAVSYEVRGRWK